MLTLLSRALPQAAYQLSLKPSALGDATRGDVGQRRNDRRLPLTRRLGELTQLQKQFAQLATLTVVELPVRGGIEHCSEVAHQPREPRSIGPTLPTTTTSGCRALLNRSSHGGSIPAV